MSEYQLRVCIGFYLIAVQLSLIAETTYYLSEGGFLFAQYTTIIGLITPLFAGYLSVIIKFFSSRKYSGEGSAHDGNISIPFAVLSFAFPTLFGLATGLCVYAAAHGIVFKNFEDVKVAISLGQGAFGIYIGQFVYSLFEEAARAASPNKKPS